MQLAKEVLIITLSDQISQIIDNIIKQCATPDKLLILANSQIRFIDPGTGSRYRKA